MVKKIFRGIITIVGQRYHYNRWSHLWIRCVPVYCLCLQPKWVRFGKKSLNAGNIIYLVFIGIYFWIIILQAFPVIHERREKSGG